MSKNLLLWEKYRPKKIEDVILPPRIINQFENGVSRNYIFHGHYGTGKTTLARILIGKYSKDKPFLEINSSLYTSIETLRNDVENFCKTQPMIESSDSYKYVFLDEFERVSSSYQDALKAFIEQYHKNVRFILTTNHISKISDGIKSRFTSIDFDCLDLSEEKLLKQELYKKITNVIVPNEGIQISKDILVNIIKVDVLFKLLGREFINWSITQKRENIEKLFNLNYIISELNFKLETNTDPIILGMTLLGKFREILIEN